MSELSQKHIIIDARFIDRSTGRYVECLLTELQKIDQTNRYTVLVKKRKDWKPSAANFTVRTAPIPDFSFAEQIKLLSIIRSLKPDLVHFTMPQYPLLFDFGRTPRVNTIHDLTMVDYKHTHWGFPVDTIKRMVFKLVMRRAAHAREVIVPSRYTKTQLLKRYRLDPSHLTITYESASALGVRSKQFRPMINRDYLLYVGNASPYKNIARLIEAFDLLKVDHPKLHLVIVGKESRFHEDLHGLVEKHGINDVHFTGFVPDEQLAWLYENARAYVFPSLSEGFGLPGLEAIHYRCPLVSSDASCLPEVYKDAAHYFNPYDIEDIRRAIEEVLTSSQLRKRLSQAEKTIRDTYSWKRMALQTLQVYETALGTNKD